MSIYGEPVTTIWCPYCDFEMHEDALAQHLRFHCTAPLSDRKIINALGKMGVLLSQILQELRDKK